MCAVPGPHTSPQDSYFGTFATCLCRPRLIWVESPTALIYQSYVAYLRFNATNYYPFLFKFSTTSRKVKCNLSSNIKSFLLLTTHTLRFPWSTGLTPSNEDLHNARTLILSIYAAPSGWCLSLETSGSNRSGLCSVGFEFNDIANPTWLVIYCGNRLINPPLFWGRLVSKLQ